MFDTTGYEIQFWKSTIGMPGLYVCETCSCTWMLLILHRRIITIYFENENEYFWTEIFHPCGCACSVVDISMEKWIGVPSTNSS